MTPLFLERVDCSRGSPMGRPERLPEGDGTGVRLQLAKVPLIDGDYDRGGAYWGGPADLYHAETANTVAVRLFVRASTRREAKDKLLDRFPGLKFYR